jgi:hypothetical protein
MSKVSFMHLRAGTASGEMSSFGGMTVAIRPSEDGKSSTIAVARCHMSDRYNKKIGRLKAAARLDAKCEVTRKKFVRQLPISADNFVEAAMMFGVNLDTLLGRDRFVRG